MYAQENFLQKKMVTEKLKKAVHQTAGSSSELHGLSEKAQSGTAICALDKISHTDHFTCFQGELQLQKQFCNVDENPFCEAC